MARSADGLLSQIEDGALDSSTPLADTLRKCVALGGQAGSAELRDWARRELDGYGTEAELPDSSTGGAIIPLDGATVNAGITGPTLPHSPLPAFSMAHTKEGADDTERQ